MKLDREGFERKNRIRHKRMLRSGRRKVAVAFLACVVLLGTALGNTSIGSMVSEFFGGLSTRTAAATVWPGPGSNDYFYLSNYINKNLGGVYYDWGYNWNKLAKVIENTPTGRPFVIEIDPSVSGWDPLVRNTITIKKGQQIKIISSAQTTFNRIGGSNFGAAFRVEEGAELWLGNNLIFEGTMRDQTTETVWVKETITTGGTSTVPAGSALSFGGIGNHFRVGGKNYVRDFNTSAYPSGIRVANGSETPTIQLFTSKDGYNKSVTSNSNNTALFDPNYYYILCYDTGLGIQVIDIEGEWARNLNAFKVLSFDEKKRFLWTVQTTSDGGRYLKNFVTGKVLTNSGNALSTTTPTITTETWVQKTQYYTHPKRALGDNASDGFPGGGFFVESSGTFTVDGAIFRDLMLPQNGVNTKINGNNSAPIVINGGEFIMHAGAISNNSVAFAVDETSQVSTGTNDQTEAKTKTRYEIETIAYSSAVNTGSAGAIIMNGGTATLYNGTIGASYPTTEAARKHFARNNVNAAENDGNKGCVGAIIVQGDAVLNLENGTKNGVSVKPVIVGNTGAQKGTIYVTGNGKLNMTGAQVIGNFNYVGGAITPTGNGTFTMNGGDIVANDTMRLGGGIMVQSNNVNLIKGDIHENTAAGAGGGIYVQGHNSVNSKILHLQNYTNVFNNFATSSGIDINPQRSTNIHKVSTTRDKYHFGLAYKEIDDGYGTHNTNDWLNTGGLGDINKNKSGSGGGIWLCPAGTAYMGQTARTLLNIGNNHAEIQGDDFMKDNGADGGILFGDGIQGYWTADRFRFDNEVALNQGWKDDGWTNDATPVATRSGADFSMNGFSASNPLKLHSKSNVGYVNNQLNIYDNVSRRGGGIGADGTLLIDQYKPEINIIQGQLSLEKQFIGVTNRPDVFMMRVLIRNKNTGDSVKVGDYLLSDDSDIVAENNSSLDPDELVHYETGYKVTIGLPQFIPDSNGNISGDGKAGIQLFDWNTGSWIANDYEIALEEYDKNGNPLDASIVMQTGDLQVVSKPPVETKESEDAKVHYKSITFGKTATNTTKPEIEKYINNRVHHDVIKQNEPIEFEIMAKISGVRNETTDYVITDTLQDELIFADQYGNPSSDVTRVIRDITVLETSDHNATGTGSVVNGTVLYSNVHTWALSTGANNANAYQRIDGKTLTLKFDTSKENWWKNFNGKWLRIRFYATFDETQYDKVLQIAQQQAANGYEDVSEGSGASERIFWRKISDNAPMSSVAAGQLTHSGVENHAHLKVTYNNSVNIEEDSNVVTVKPNEPVIEKYINDVVHADLMNFNEIFVYDIMAYVPEGATQVTITDELIKELQFCGYGNAPVVFDSTGNLTSGNADRVIFSSRQGLSGNGITYFDIRTTNNHYGDATGSVTETNSSAIRNSYPATTANGRLLITEQNGRQKLVLTLDKNAEGDRDKGIFEAIESTNARWIHLTFKARIRPEYYVEIANQLSKGTLNADNDSIGWKMIDSGTKDKSVLNGSLRSGSSTPVTIDYDNAGFHAGEMNRASMAVTVSNGASSTDRTVESNIVTLKPELTSLQLTKHWINTTTDHLHFTGDYVQDEAFIRTFVNSLTLSCVTTGSETTSDSLLGIGSDYTVDTVTHLNGTYPSDDDPRHWVITWKKNGSSLAADTSPVMLTITTSNGVSRLQDGKTRISWDLNWTNLPKLSNGTWHVTESQMTGEGFEAPVYGSSNGYATNGESISNTHRNDAKTRVDVEKRWENISPSNSDRVAIALFARFKDANGQPVVLAISNGNNEPEWITYGQYFSEIKATSIEGDSTGPGWMRIGASGNPELNWKGYWEELPQYLNGDESNPISYEIREAHYISNPRVSFFTGSEGLIGNYVFENEPYSYVIDGGEQTSTEGSAYQYTLTNEKAVIEKYVNQSVHAELPGMDDIFEYDLMVYVPHGATSVLVEDPLPQALEFVDWNGNAFGSAGFNNGNALLRSVRGGSSPNGRFDVWSVHDHDGSGSGYVANVNAHENASRPNMGTYTVPTGALSVVNETSGEQKLRLELNTTNASGLFSNIEQYDMRWIQLRFCARIRPEHRLTLASRLGGNTGYNDLLKWTTVTKNGTIEGVRGDGTIINARKDSFDGTFTDYGTSHTGVANRAYLTIDQSPVMSSNTVTVTSRTISLSVQKNWINTTAQVLGYENGYWDADRIKAFASSLKVTDGTTQSNGSYQSVTDGFTMSDPVVNSANRNEWTIRWTKTEGTSTVTHPMIMKIVADNTVNTTGSGSVIRWNVTVSGLPDYTDTTKAWRIVESKVTGMGAVFDEPVHQHTNAYTGGIEGYAFNNEAISNIQFNNETVYVSVHKQWVNMTPDANDSVEVKLIATLPNGTNIPLTDSTFAGTSGSDAFDVNNITLKSSDNWNGGWLKLPKYYRNDTSQSAENLIRYSVEEVSYKKNDIAIAQGDGYRSYVIDNSNNDFTIVNEAPAIEKYVGKAVHQEIGTFDTVFYYDILAFVPKNSDTVTITDTLPEELEFIDSNGQTLYTYDRTTGTRQNGQNSSFVKNNVMVSARSNKGPGFYDAFAVNDHKGDGTGSVAQNDDAQSKSYEVRFVNNFGSGGQGLIISSAGKDAPQTMTFTINGRNATLFNESINQDRRWIHLRFSVRIRPEQYAAVASRLALEHETWQGDDNELNGWSIVKNDGVVRYGESIDGDGSVIQGRMLNANGSYVNYGSAHAGLKNSASIKVDNSPEIKSNTVTVVPLTTSMTITKNWVGDDRFDRFMIESGYIQKARTDYVAALADNFLISSEAVADLMEYGGTWVMDTPERLDATGWSNWRVTWSVNGEKAPITLYLTSSNSPVTLSDSNTGVQWIFRWEGIPEISGNTWTVREKNPFTFTSNAAGTSHSVVYDSAVYPGEQSYAKNGEEITNIRIHDDTTSLHIDKLWNLMTPGENARVEVDLVASYRIFGAASNTTKRGSAITNDAFFASKNVSGTVTIGSVDAWEKTISGLPLYYQGYLTQPITYDIEEVRYYEGNTLVEAGSNYSTRKTHDGAGNYTLTNESSVIEKYVNKAVHAELNTFDEVFTYDVIAYVPAETTEIEITDPLIPQLEFVYRDSGNNYQPLQFDASGNALEEGMSRSVYVTRNGETRFGEIAFRNANNHLGNGTGTVTDDSNSNIKASYPVLRADGSSRLAIRQDAATKAQTITITLDKDHTARSEGRNNADADIFTYAIERDNARWIQFSFDARIRSDAYGAVAHRIAQKQTEAQPGDDTLHWAIVGVDGTTLNGLGSTGGDGSVVNAEKISLDRRFVSYGTKHAGLTNAAQCRLTIGNGSRAKVKTLSSNNVTVVPIKGEVSFNKQWNDSNDRYLTRISPVQFKDLLTLFSVNGSDVTTLNGADMTVHAVDAMGNYIPNAWTGAIYDTSVTLTITSDPENPALWNVEWSGLPKFNDMHYYTMSESTIAAYRTSYDNTAARIPDGIDGTTIVNAMQNGTIRNTLSLTSIKVYKIWRDNDNALGIRPDAITLTVSGVASDGSTVLDTYVQTVRMSPPATTVGEGDQAVTVYNWPNTPDTAAFTITDLPRYYYDSENNRYHEYVYTVTETAVPGYVQTDAVGNVLGGTDLSVSVTGSGEAGALTLYNTISTELDIQKHWLDGAGDVTHRPQSIRVIVRGRKDSDNTQVFEETVDITSEDGWVKKLKNLPAYVDGSSVSYEVTEDISSLDESAYRIRGSSTVIASSVASGGLRAELTNERLTDLTIHKTWRVTNASDLPSFIRYRFFGIVTKPSSDPNSSQAEIIRYVPEGDSINGFSLRTDPSGYAYVEADDSKGWIAAIKNLPMYDADGYRISYYAEEYSISYQGTEYFFNNGSVTTPAHSYQEQAYTGDARAFRNETLSFTNTETSGLSLKKQWIGDDDSVRPKEILIKISGTVLDETTSTEQVVMTERNYIVFVEGSVHSEDDTHIRATVSGGGLWEFQIPELTVYDAQGRKINYKVTEAVPEGYSVSPAAISGTLDAPLTENAFTNTKVNETTISAEKIWSPLPADETARSVRVKLLATINGNEIDSAEDALNAGIDDAAHKLRTIEYEVTIPYSESGMKHTWANLPTNTVISGVNTPVTYQVIEVSAPEGYESNTNVTTDATGARLYTITNAKPSIEKYVNQKRNIDHQASAHSAVGTYDGDDGGVHTDLLSYDEVFTYDIQAYITGDADEVVIEDLLNEAFTVVDENGNSLPDGPANDAVYVVVKTASDDGAARELSDYPDDSIYQGGTRLPSGALSTNITTVTDTGNGRPHQKISVTLDLRRLPDESARNELRGKWMQVTFNARIRENYLTPEALVGLKKDVLEGVDGYTTIPSDTPIDEAKMNIAQESGMTYRLVVDGDPSTQDAHTGAMNQASYRIRVGDYPNRYTRKSNVVTVDPEVTSVSVYKEWIGNAPQVTEETLRTFLNNLEVRRTDGGTDAYLWGSGEYDTADVTQRYQWSDLTSNGTDGEYLLTLEGKDTLTDLPDTDRLRTVKIETAPLNPNRITDSTNVWKVTFSALPVLTNVDYYVVEKDRAVGYLAPLYNNTLSATHTSSVTGAFDNGSILNIYNVPLTLEINKNWVDDNNRARFRPEEVYFVLAAAKENTNDFKIVNVSTPDAPFISARALSEYDSLIDAEKADYRIVVSKPDTDTENNSSDPWKNLNITNLPQYVQGTLDHYTYRLIEVEGDSRYTITQPDNDITALGTDTTIAFTATNTYNEQSTSIRVIKKWNDDGYERHRPDNVTVQLYQSVNGAEETPVDGKTLTITPDQTTGEWSAEFTDLPDARNISYSVKEITPEGYQSTILQQAQRLRNGVYSDVEIENRPVLKSIGLMKEWHNDDPATRTGIQIELRGTIEGGSSVITRSVTLPLNGVAPADATDADWRTSFNDLPVTHNGKKITYSVRETVVPDGYSVSYAPAEGILLDTAALDASFTITNDRDASDENDLKMVKVWKNDDGAESKRPERITFILYQIDNDDNRSEYDRITIVPTDSDKKHWMIEGSDPAETEFVFKNLPEKDIRGNLYRYEIEELMEGQLNHYDSAIPAVIWGNNVTITNTCTTPETTDLMIEKEWLDGNNALNTRPQNPASINVTLSADNPGYDLAADGVETEYTVPRDPVTGKWQLVINGLRKYINDDAKSGEIRYRITETLPDGYEQSGYREDDTNPSERHITITNQLRLKTNLTIEKIWDDNNDASLRRPQEITVVLKQNDTVYGSKVITPDAAGNWQTEFNDLDLCDEYGNLYTYEVEEQDYEGSSFYDTHIMNPTIDTSGGAYARIENTYLEPGKVNLRIEKHWLDGNNALNLRKDVTIKLSAENDDSINEFYVLSSDDYTGNVWTKTITGLYKYKEDNPANGEIRYRLEEVTMDDPSADIHFTASVDNSGMTGASLTGRVTNTLSGKTSVHVRKQWNDAGHENERPEIIEVELFNGVSLSPVETLTLQAPGWEAVFDSLELCAPDGTPYEYTVREVPPHNSEEYSTDIVQPVWDPVTCTYLAAEITNTRIVPDKTRITAEKTWEGDTDLTSIGFTLSAGNYNLAANGIPTSYTMTKNALGEWKMEINDLPKLTNGTTGDEINYKLSENVPNGYTLKSTDVQDQPDGKHFVFTNVKKAPPKISVSIRKVWKDTGYESDRALIAVTLVRNGIKLPEKTAVLNELNGYSATITDLEEFDSDGNRYVYSVEESFNGIDNYEVSVAQTGTQLNKNEIVVTNTRKPEKVSVRASKTWVDQTAAGRPQSIIIHLLRNGQRIAQKTISGPDWDDAVFEDLDKYSSVTGSTKTLYRYTVEEEMTTNAGSYMVSIEQPQADGSDYTARIKNSATQKTTASTKATTGKTSTGATTTAATGKTTSTGATTSASLPTRGTTSVINQIRTTPQDNIKTVHKLTEEEAGSALGMLRNMVNNARNVLTNDPTSVLYPVLLLISMGGLPFLIGISKKKDEDDDHGPDGGGRMEKEKKATKKNTVKKDTVKKDTVKKKSTAGKKKAGKKKEEPKIRLKVH